MVNSLHTNANRERIISREQTSSKRPFDLRRELNTAWTACMVVVRPIEQKRSKTKAEIDLLKKMSAKMGEIAEQLELLNLCDFIQEFDAENLQKAISDFDAETQRMKGETS